jgi:tetratricopeptide (TPR) repeat protein
VSRERTHSTLTRLLFIASAAGLALGGCRAPGPAVRPEPVTQAQADAALDPLRARAQQELASPHEPSRSAPPPAGISQAEVEPQGELPAGSPALATLADALAKHRSPLPDAPAAAQPAPEEAIRLYVRGRARLLDGHAAEAIADLEEAARLDPASPTVLRELAEAQLDLGRRASAVVTLSRAVRQGLREPRALAILGREALRARRHEESLGWLTHALDMDPPHEVRVLAGVDAAESLAELGYLRASRDALTEALARPMGIAAVGRYRLELAEVHRRRAELWRRAGDLSCRLGEFDRADQCYQSAAASPSADPAAVIPRRVYALLKQGRPADAALLVLDDIRDSGGRVEDRHLPLLTHIASTADLGPSIADALSALSRSLGPQGSPTVASGLARASAAVLPADQAQTVLVGHLSTAPRDPAAVTDLLVLLHPQPPARQARVLTELIEANPGSVAVIASGIVAYGGGTTAMLDALQSSGRPAARLLLAVARTKLDDPRRALELLADFPPSGALVPPWLIAEAGAASDAGDLPRLESAKARALALADSGVPGARRAAASVCALSGDPAGALSLLEPLVAPEAPGDRETLLEAAGLRLSQNDAAGAEADLLRVIRLDPYNERAYEGLFHLYNTGGPLADSNKLAGTARALRQAVPSSRVVRAIGAQELVNRSLWPQAEASLLALMDPASEDPEALGMLISVWERAASAQPELTARGEAWLRQRLAARPQAPGLIIGIARLLVAQGRADQAEPLLAQAYADLGMTDLARLREWVLREGLDRPQEADALARERLARSPKTVSNVIELASILAAAGEYEEAAAQFATDFPADAALSPEQTARLVQLLGRLKPQDLPSAGPRVAQGALRLFDLVVARGLTLSAPLQVARLTLLTIARADQTQQILDACAELGRNFPELQDQAYLQAAQALAAGEPAGPILRFLPAAADRSPKLESTFLFEWIRLTCLRGDASDVRRLVETADPPRLLKILLERRTVGFEIPDAPTEQRAELAYQIASEINSLERTEVAIAAYRIALEHQPDHAWTCNNLGYLLVESGGDLNEAERLVEIALRRLADDYHVIDTLAWIRYKRGHLADTLDAQGAVQTPGAVTLLRRAADLAAAHAANAGEVEDSTIFDHLCDALWRTGARDEALKAWRTAAESLASVLQSIDAQRLPTPGEEPQFVRTLRAELDAVRAKLDAAQAGNEPSLAPLISP